MADLPRDPCMLLSVVNTRLRDQYSSLDALCDDLDADRADLESTLGRLGYRYDPEHNAFVPDAPASPPAVRKNDARCANRPECFEESP